jgi:hypothetical protein
MIKGINPQGMFTQVSGGSPSGNYYQTGQPMSGMTRYVSNNLEVYDGSSWQQIGSSYASIGLTANAEAAINWALSKMNEEAELEKLSSEHPAVKAAYDNMKRAAEQLKATIILSKEHDNQTTS